MYKKIILLIICLEVLILPSKMVMADEISKSPEDKIREFIVEFSEDTTEFEEFLECDNINKTSLYNLEGESCYTLFEFLNNNKYSGYLIWDNNSEIVLELSKGDSAYNSFNLKNDEYDIDYIWIYQEGNYAVKTVASIVWFDESGDIYATSNVGKALRVVLPGVYPQLQKDKNCIVAAVANLLYYWSGHGYSALNYASSFEAIKSQVNALFNGVYANNSVPDVMKSYCGSVGYKVTSTVNWNPNINLMISEISNNRPCLLGFAAGSPYSDIEGHMTMCCGYKYTAGVYYSALADGHSSSIVYKVWSNTYNDCIIVAILSK